MAGTALKAVISKKKIISSMVSSKKNVLVEWHKNNWKTLIHRDFYRLMARSSKIRNLKQNKEDKIFC